MSIAQLPIHIWLNIIHCGNLSFKDILTLSLLSKTIHEQFKYEDYIWRSVFYKTWEQPLVDYGVPTLMQTLSLLLNGSTHLSYTRSIEFHKKSEKYISQIAKYDPEGSHNISYYLEEFTQENDYIPILISQLNEAEESMAASAETFDLSKIALTQNLLVSQNYRLGMEHLRNIATEHSNTRKPHLSDYELYWFKLCYFDKSFHRLVPNRMKKLARIQQLLHQEVYVKELLNDTSTKNYQFEPQSERKGKLTFSDDFSFVSFVTRIIVLTLTEFTITTKINDVTCNRYLESYYLEDFDILRIYSNEVMGHPLLIYSILLKVINDFLKENFEIIIKGKEGFQISLSKHFIHLNNHFILIDSKTSITTYNVKVFTRYQVIEKLRATHNMTTPEKILKFLEPIDLNFFLMYYLTLDLSGYSDSISSFLETQELLEEVSYLNIWYPQSRIGFHKEEYKLIKFFYECIQDNDYTVDVKLKSKANAMFGYLNTFIHYKSFLNTINQNIIELNGLSMKQVQNKVVELTLETTDTILPVGAFVLHSRLKMYGIIVGFISRGTQIFFKVLTQFGTLETFREKALKKVVDNRKLNDFLVHSAVDVLGLIYCKSYKGGKFEMYNYSENQFPVYR